MQYTETDNELLASIKNSNLSENSKKSYLERLRTLQNHTGMILLEILRHPNEMFQNLQEYYTEIQSQKAYINAILALFKYHSKLKSAFPMQLQIWKQHFDTVHRKIETNYDNNSPSAKQKTSFMPWQNIIKKREQLPKNSIEYLWLCCHTMIPPMRADLDKIKIFTDREPSQKEIKDNPNFLLMQTKRVGDWIMKLILTEFKTAKSMKQYQKVLPAELCAVIKKSLLRSPRDFLFVSNSTGLPFNNTATYTRFANRLLQKIFKPHPITISMLRHIFVSNLDHGKLTSGEKTRLARDMMHSPSTFDRYRLIFDDHHDDEYMVQIDENASADGVKKICKCKCKDAPFPKLNADIKYTSL